MSWTVVAAADFRHAVRSRLLQATVGTIVFALVILAVGLSFAGERVTAGGAIAYVISLLEWMVPAIGLFVGYGAVVGERDARTIQHLLTAPPSRLDIVVGKVGRGPP